MVAWSSSGSPSSAAETVTVCAVSQFVSVKVSEAGGKVMSASPDFEGVNVTLPVGCESSVTV